MPCFGGMMTIDVGNLATANALMELTDLRVSLIGSNLWIINKNLPDADPESRAFAFKLVILILCKRHYQKLSVVFDFSISDTFSLGLAS